MCHPAVYAAYIAMSAISATQQAKTTKAVNKQQSAIAEFNADASDRLAEDAIARGDLAAGHVERQSRALQGKQKAALGARGVNLDVGTPLDILVGTTIVGEVDQATVKENAKREAFGFTTQGLNYRSKSSVHKGVADATNPLMAGTTSALGAASTVGGSWGAWSQKNPNSAWAIGGK